MTNNNRGRRRRGKPTAVGFFTATLFLVLMAQSRVSAQSNVTTVIVPTRIATADGTTVTGDIDTSSRINLTFEAPALPAGAQVVKATLQLSLKNMLSSAAGQLGVKFIGSDKQEVNFGSRPFTKDTPGQDHPMR